MFLFVSLNCLAHCQSLLDILFVYMHFHSVINPWFPRAYKPVKFHIPSIQWTTANLHSNKVVVNTVGAICFNFMYLTLFFFSFLLTFQERDQERAWKSFHHKLVVSIKKNWYVERLPYILLLWFYLWRCRALF